ncbi:Glutathione S-transferase [Balamuthia mandrillaris]
MSSAEAIKFYGNPICPFAHRAWWTAKEKEVPIEFIHIELGDKKPAWYAQEVNPRGTVPAIKAGDHVVLESLIVSEFFEDAYAEQGTSLLPKDALLRADIRLFIDQFGQVLPVFYGLLRNQDREKDEELKKQILDKLHPLLELLKKQSEEGPFFLGQQLSLADTAVLPFIERFSVVLKHYRGFDLLEVDPRLKRWLEAARERPAFQETTREPEFFIEGYAKYANPQ